MIPVIPFKNLQLASNDSVGYYQLNRVFDRTYDFIQTVSANVNVEFSPLSSIPYATETIPGLVKYAPTITTPGNLIISSQQVSSYICDNFDTFSTCSSINPNLYVTSGYNQLLNGLKIQFGHQLINTSASSASFQSLSGAVVFNIDTPSQYEILYPPVVLFQILDSIDHLKYKYRYSIYNLTFNGFNFIVDVTKNTPDIVNKSNFYITWAAIGA